METDKIAIYPGSFDPITFGHIDVIRRSQKIFDKVIVAVLENSQKQCMFSAQERIKMIMQACPSVRVESFSGLLVDFLRKEKANFIIRGLRAVSDFEYEFQMEVANKNLCPDAETVLVMTDKEYFYLSSTLVKELAKGRAPLDKFVPRHVEEALRSKFR